MHDHHNIISLYVTLHYTYHEWDSTLHKSRDNLRPDVSLPCVNELWISSKVSDCVA